MFVRFTEFVTLYEQDICLYVIREDSDQQGKAHFKVQIWAGNDVLVIVCRQMEKNWEILTQNAPHWVYEMEHEILVAIEQRVCQE